MRLVLAVCCPSNYRPYLFLIKNPWRLYKARVTRATVNQSMSIGSKQKNRPGGKKGKAPGRCLDDGSGCWLTGTGLLPATVQVSADHVVHTVHFNQKRIMAEGSLHMMVFDIATRSGQRMHQFERLFLCVEPVT